MPSLTRPICECNRQKHEASVDYVPVHFRVTDAVHVCSGACISDSNKDGGHAPPGRNAASVPAASSQLGAASNAATATSRQPDGPDGQPDSSETQTPGDFDFIIDTFGLCSHAAPVEVLKVTGCNLDPHCGPTECPFTSVQLGASCLVLLSGAASLPPLHSRV